MPSEQEGQSSYCAQFSPTGFDKLKRAGVMLPTLDSLSPLPAQNNTNQSRLDTFNLQEIELKSKSNNNDEDSIKAGERVIQAVDDIVTSSKAFNLMDSQIQMTEKSVGHGQKQKGKRRNFNININNMELRHQSSH